MEYLTIQPLKKNEVMPFAATWMKLEILILSKVSETERQILYDIIYMWNLMYDTNEPTLQNRNRLRHGKQDCGCQAGGRRGGRGMDWEFGVNRCELDIYVRMCIYVYMTGLLCFTEEICTS